jgi:hypothetical protein
MRSGGTSLLARPSLLIQDDPSFRSHERQSPSAGWAAEGAIVEVVTKGYRIDLSKAQWSKSTRSGPGQDNCVEVAFVEDAIAVRDSQRPDGPVLIFTPAEWDAFVGGAKDGEFDL